MRLTLLCLTAAALLTTTACAPPDRATDPVVATLDPSAGPSHNSVVYPDSAPTLPANLAFAVDSVSDPRGIWVTASWTDTNAGTALVDFGIPSPYYSPYQIVKSSWYGTQTSESWWLPIGVYDVHVRTRAPYQPAFVMPDPDNVVDPSRVKYSDWSSAYVVDGTFGGTFALVKKQRKK